MEDVSKHLNKKIYRASSKCKYVGTIRRKYNALILDQIATGYTWDQCCQRLADEAILEPHSSSSQPSNISTESKNSELSLRWSSWADNEILILTSLGLSLEIFRWKRWPVKMALAESKRTASKTNEL